LAAVIAPSRVSIGTHGAPNATAAGATADRAEWDQPGGYEPGEVEQPPVIGFLARFIRERIGFGDRCLHRAKEAWTLCQVRLRCIGAMTAEDERYVQTLKRRLDAAGASDDAEFLPNVSREEKIAAPADADASFHTDQTTVNRSDST